MENEILMRMCFRKKRGDLLAKHKAELTGMLYAYARVALPPEEEKDFKQRVEELINRHKREIDAFYDEANAELEAVEGEQNGKDG